MQIGCMTHWKWCIILNINLFSVFSRMIERISALGLTFDLKDAHWFAWINGKLSLSSHCTQIGTTSNYGLWTFNIYNSIQHQIQWQRLLMEDGKLLLFAFFSSLSLSLLNIIFIYHSNNTFKIC